MCWCCQELNSRKRVLYSDHEPSGSFDDFACDADSVSRMRSVMTQILAMETAAVRESPCQLRVCSNSDLLKLVAPNLEVAW
jgi:hypothetical protein